MNQEKSPGFLRRIWRASRRPSAKWSVLSLLVIGFLGGAVFLGGFQTTLGMTNKLEFCIGCHEMRDNVYQEYKKTIHYSNRSGVRATCPDCHVPHELGPTIVRKIKASKEVWGKLIGTIDTPEKFQAHRMAMATSEWARMEANNSQECRNCHNFDAMSKDAQKLSNYNRHMKAQAEGETCIDCHKGIAHRLPPEYRDPNEEE
uniref:NapC/NirT family cytochrome c n=1 Tax=Castellaniella defragrans TaxID=75697 RepID=UPI003340AA43